MGKLAERHRRFADEWLKNPNGTAAAIAAGYSAKGAGVTAHELLQRSDVKAYLASRTGKLVAVAEADVERITRELAAIGFADVTVLFVESPEGPRLRPLSEWPAEVRVCIASIETSRRVVGIKRVTGDKPEDGSEPEESLVQEAEIITKIKLWPKVQALELLARYRKMLDGGAGSVAPGGGFVGMQITVAPGAQLNVQVNNTKG